MKQKVSVENDAEVSLIMTIQSKIYSTTISTIHQYSMIYISNERLQLLELCF